MSKKQLGSSVQVFCSNFNSEPVEIKWEYKTPTLRTAPNMTDLQVHVGDNYFDFKTYYRPMFTVNKQEIRPKYREEAAFIPRVISVNFTDQQLQGVNPLRTRIDGREQPPRDRFGNRYRKYHWEKDQRDVPCAATCDTAVQLSNVNCVARNGTRVDERYCDPR